MYTKYDIFNESLKDKLKGKSENDIINMIKNNSPEDILIKSSKYGILDGVKLSLDKKVNINYNNGIAIRFAVKENYYNIVKYLIDNGANVNVENNWCIKTSVKWNRYKLTKLLIDNTKEPIDYLNFIKFSKDKDTETTKILREYNDKMLNDLVEKYDDQKSIPFEPPKGTNSISLLDKLSDKYNIKVDKNVMENGWVGITGNVKNLIYFISDIYETTLKHAIYIFTKNNNY